MWTIFIGENNTGKSTLLQALALTAVSQTGASSLAMSMTGGWVDNLIRQGQKKASVVSRTLSGDATLSISNGEIASHRSSDHPLRLLGYGPWRRLPDEAAFIQPASSTSTLEGLRSLFDPSAPLAEPESWLRTQDYLRRSNEPHVLEIARNALVSLLPDVKEVTVSPRGVTVRTNRGMDVPLKLMSEGYKVMTTLVVDIVARLAPAQSIQTPEEIEATVLIDELDLHLHPRWQLRVVDDLRAMFPRIQFIVTTHSPLILLGARKGEVIQLKWHGDAIRCVRSDMDPERLKVDQVLYDLFELSHVRGPEAPSTDPPPGVPFSVD